MKIILILFFTSLTLSGCFENQSNISSIDNNLANSAEDDINQCYYEIIHRDDGTIITQFISLPVASDSTLEFGLAISSNGIDYFIASTLRFFHTAKSITGDLSIRLQNNNLMTFSLINESLSYIGNSQVAHGIFSLNNQQVQKLILSDIYTISIRLGDNIIHTLDCKNNKGILRNQLKCLLEQKNSDKHRTYSSQKYQYEINLPDGFEKTVSNNEHIDLKLISNDGSSIIINISERLPEEYNITAHNFSKDYFINLFKQYPIDISLTKAEKVYIRDIEAFLINYINGSNETKALEIYLYRQDYAYVLTATTSVDNFSSLENTFLSTLNSIKFK